ncbi:hypothetical protein E6C55_32405 [Cohnella fermenti]|uniref:Uncharacterized protein n=1 Tax=Cohnella fermenti TaxID=2565925 RepID=A0A4S4BKK0_9BACL|nr:hypothetical protein E6C55_32405 [Cohnella fermenti]
MYAKNHIKRLNSPKSKATNVKNHIKSQKPADRGAYRTRGQRHRTREQRHRVRGQRHRARGQRHRVRRQRHRARGQRHRVRRQRHRTRERAHPGAGHRAVPPSYPVELSPPSYPTELSVRPIVSDTLPANRINAEKLPSGQLFPRAKFF